VQPIANIKQMPDSPIALRDHEHRTWCDLQHPIRNATEQQSFQRPASDIAKNDEVGDASGSVCDRVCRAGDSHVEQLEPRIKTGCLRPRTEQRTLSAD
jgi:hypothetical protein